MDQVYHAFIWLSVASNGLFFAHLSEFIFLSLVMTLFFVIAVHPSFLWLLLHFRYFNGHFVIPRSVDFYILHVLLESLLFMV